MPGHSALAKSVGPVRCRSLKPVGRREHGNVIRNWRNAYKTQKSTFLGGEMTYTIRIVSGIIAAFFICFPLAWFNTTPKSEQLPNTYYFTFTENFMFPFIIMILIYTFMAVPYSIFVDRVTYHYIRPKWIKFMASSFLYIIGGIIGLTVFFFIIGRGIDFRMINITTVYLGGLSAFIYMLVLRIIEFIFRKSKGTRKSA